MSEWIDCRRSAVLLHLTALPGRGPWGGLGMEAFRFIDHICEAGFSVWQFLPLGPTHAHGSPYESLSSFAGDPRLIDLLELVHLGLLTKDSLTHHDAMSHQMLLRQAADAFLDNKVEHRALSAEFELFCASHKEWLDDYAAFAAIRSMHDHRPWWQWPDALRRRNADAIRSFARAHPRQLDRIRFVQFVFERQWHRLKAYAEEKGLLLFGDLPIYVAHDSADVWATPEFFTLREDGHCETVAGVPPDYFSTTGQRWGNPLYRWERLEADNFSWWVRRVEHQMQRMHLLRIDHFRALAAYWAIPSDRQDGIVGEWHSAPGEELLRTLRTRLGHLPLVAEDLGIITEDVIELRRKFGLPGMKILQFAFDGNPENPYLPEHHEDDSVVYTGTHDNDTTLGWFRSLDKATRTRVLEYLHCKSGDMPWALIEAALGSRSLLAVIPLQDLLELGSEARFNTPGTLEGNWQWRLDAMPSAEAPCWLRARRLNERHQRLPSPSGP